MGRQAGVQEDDIIELARRETDPACFDDFQPITRGPVVAVAGLLGLALVVPAYLAWRWLAGSRRPDVRP